MTRKPGAPKWKIVERTLLPNSIELYDSNSPGTFAYMNLVYRVVEQSADSVRERRETRPYYFHEHGDLSVFGSIALTCIARMHAAALGIDAVRKKAKVRR